MLFEDEDVVVVLVMVLKLPPSLAVPLSMRGFFGFRESQFPPPPDDEAPTDDSPFSPSVVPPLPLSELLLFSKAEFDSSGSLIREKSF